MKFEKFMQWVREQAVDMGIPAIPESTGKFLSLFTYTFAKDKKFINIVELGAGIGYSVLWMLDGVLKAEEKCKIHAIERERVIFEKSREILKEAEELKGFDLNNYINFHLKDAEELKGDEFEKIDLLFLDIHKKGYYSALLKFEKQIKEKGVVIAHNVLSHQEELKNFLKEIKREDKYTTFFLETDPQGISVSFKK